MNAESKRPDSFDDCWVLRWYAAFEVEIGCGDCSLIRRGADWLFRWTGPRLKEPTDTRRFAYENVLTLCFTPFSFPEEQGRMAASEVRGQWGGELDTVSRM